MGFGKDGKGQILWDDVSADLGTLTNRDAVVIGGKYDAGVLNQHFRIIKIDYFMGIKPSASLTFNNGPVLFGISRGDLAASEIEQAIEALPLDPQSTALEQSMRVVIPLEVMTWSDAAVGEDTPPFITGSKTIRWTFIKDDGWTWWAYNMSAQNLETGTFINIIAKIFGVWVL